LNQSVRPESQLPSTGWHDSEAETRGSLAILGFLLVGAGLVYLFGDIVFGSAVQSNGDILAYYYPVRSAIRSLWLEHHSLAWNPFLGEGQPLAGNPEHELFYPFTWLLFVFSVARATAVIQAVHFVAGWLGMRRLLVKLGCSEGGAILGAIAWGFGGLWISSTHFFPVFLAWAWIPWLAAGAAEPQASFRGAVRDSLLGALILSIGEPVTALAGALAYAAVFLTSPPTKERLRKALLTAAFSIAMAAATLFPAAALTRKSVRAAGIADSVAMRKSFPVARLVELLAPRSTGNVVPHSDRDYFAWRLYPEKRWPFYEGLYAGAFFAPLALAGALAEIRRSRFLLLVGAGAFVLALGTAGGAWRALRQVLPFWRGIRYPEKLLAPAIFLAVILMAWGFDAIGRSAGLRRFVIVWLSTGGIVFGAAAALPGLWTPFLNPSIRDSAAAFEAVLVRAAIAHFAFTALLLLRSRLERSGVFAAGFLLLASIDVLSSSRDFIRTRSLAQMESKPPVVAELERHASRSKPRAVDLLPYRAPVPVPGADEVNGPWDRNRVFGEQLVQWGIPLALDVDYDLTYIAASDRARELLLRAAADTSEFGELLAQRSACALLVWKRPLTLEDPVGIVGIRGCRPEVDSATAVLPFQGDDEFLRIARENKGRLARSVFVEGPSPAISEPPCEATISGVSSAPNAVSFHAECASPSFARVARTNDGNWTALLDGRSTPVRTVDLSLIGVPIPSGSHRIDLIYRDRLLNASVGISVVASLLAVGILVSGAVVRSRRRSAA
jgi:hypothetical protein